MSDFDVTSPTNERIKRLVRLKDRRHRDREKSFVVEGQRLLHRAVEAGLTPTEVYFDPEHIAPDADWVSVSSEVLNKASYRHQSEGVIAIFEQFATDLGGIETGSVSLVLITEGIEKPGNLGAMLRTADAVGADALIAVDAGVDLFNPNVLRTSTGAVFTVPFASARLDQLGPWLTENSLRLVVASPNSDNAVWDTDLSGSLALAIGSESDGLTPGLMSLSDATLSIPMAGLADSLNASVAMAVIAFEAKRQRTHA